MKAVVVEFKSDMAAVLSDDGCIVTVKNKNYEIGQIIQLSRPNINFTKKIATFTASAAAFVILSVGAWAYASPYSYVSVDVNPSIEFTVNRFDRVLRVKAVNDDGESILREISLTSLNNKTIGEALTKTVDQLSKSGYLDGTNEGGIVITTSGKNAEKSETLAQELKQTAEIEIAEIGNDVEVKAFSIKPEPDTDMVLEKAKNVAEKATKKAIVAKDNANVAENKAKDAEDSAKAAEDEAIVAEDKSKAAAENAKNTTERWDRSDKSFVNDKNRAEKAAKNAKKDAIKAKKDANKAKEDADKSTEKAKRAIEDADKAEEDANKDSDNSNRNSNSDTDNSNRDIDNSNRDSDRDSDNSNRNSD